MGSWRVSQANDSTQVRFEVDKTVTGRFRPEKIVVADLAAKRRNHRPTEVKKQADKSCFRMKVNLSLAFSSFQALKKRLGMKSDTELTWFLLDR